MKGGASGFNRIPPNFAYAMHARLEKRLDKIKRVWLRMKRQNYLDD